MPEADVQDSRWDQQISAKAATGRRSLSRAATAPKPLHASHRVSRPCGMLLLGVGLLVTSPVQALHVAPITLAQPSGLQALELPPEQQAVVDRGWPERVRIVDAQGRVMPIQRVALSQRGLEQRVPVQRYQWPALTQHWTEPERALLRLQLERGNVEASLSLPSPRVLPPPQTTESAVAVPGEEGHSSSRSRSLSEVDRPAGSVWLLKQAELANDPRDWQGDEQLVLDWGRPQGQGIRVQASLEGGDDLQHWTLLDQRELMQAPSAEGGGWIEQNRLSVRHFRYWRLTLSQPLPIQSVQLLRPAQHQPLMREYAVPLTPGQPGEWLVDLGAAWTVQHLRLEVPMGQVWAVALDQRQQSGLGDPVGWQNAVQGTVERWPQMQRDTLPLPMPRTARYWRLRSPAITQEPKLYFGVAQEQLWFLAQGQGPYRLHVADAQEAVWPSSALESLDDQGRQPALAQLGAFDHQRSLWRYGLWAALGLGLLILLGLVWRLSRTIKSSG